MLCGNCLLDDADIRRWLMALLNPDWLIEAIRSMLCL
jgi:hypothetical protein